MLKHFEVRGIKNDKIKVILLDIYICKTILGKSISVRSMCKLVRVTALVLSVTKFLDLYNKHKLINDRLVHDAYVFAKCLLPLLFFLV